MQQGSGPPTWFIFLLGMALVFGGFYLWTNLQTFMRTGGLSVSEATVVSQQVASETAVRRSTVVAALPTRRPTATPRPACTDFAVNAASAILRQQPTTSAALIDSLPEGTIICVLDSVTGDDGFTWYLIDTDPITRFIETGYMREDVVRPVNPTPTPTRTALPAPSITPLPEITASAAATIRAEDARPELPLNTPDP